MRPLIACIATPVFLAAIFAYGDASAYGDSSRRTAGSRSAGLSVEQKLQQPADLDLGDTDTISIGAVLDQIRERHGLRVQLYRGTAMLMSLCLDMVQNDDGNTASGVQGGVVFSSPGSTLSGGYLRDDVQYFPPAPDAVAVPAATSYPATPASVATSPQATPAVPAPPTPEPLTPDSPAAESTESEETTDDGPVLPAMTRSEQRFRACPISATMLRGDDLTIEELLRAVIAQIPSPLDDEEFAALPVTYTHAYTWDLLIREEGVYVTTRAQANLHKTARVYRVPAGGDFTPEELAEVVRRTIRPWSWRDQIDEIVNRIEIDVPPGAALPTITQMPTIDLASGTIVQNASDGAASPAAQKNQDATTVEPENAEAGGLSVKALGSLLSSGTIAAAHALINSLEMMHYADPPTATIEVLPGMLIISHSRTAHREIADLLQQIEASMPDNVAKQ
ncbi:MAG: hypothetical protein ACF8TS_14305 [Maioricimonas sp. JB049]